MYIITWLMRTYKCLSAKINHWYEYCEIEVKKGRDGTLECCGQVMEIKQP
jgi:hypothetical protein